MYLKLDCTAQLKKKKLAMFFFKKISFLLIVKTKTLKVSHICNTTHEKKVKEVSLHSYS